MKDKKTAFERANPLSYLTFWWITPLISLGRRNKLKEEDLELPAAQTADATYTKFKTFWDAELKTTKPNIIRALRKAFWQDFLIAGFFKLAWGALVILGAFYFVRSLVTFVQHKDGDLTNGWIWAGCFFVDCILFSISLQQMSSKCSIAGIKIRAALMTAIYNKSMVLESPNSGDVINLVGTDCSKIMDGCTSIHYLWSGPLESLAIIGTLIYLIGISALVGLGLLILIIPALYFLGHKIAEARGDGIASTEKRVVIISEVLMAIKLVKFYAWEESFSSAIDDIRKSELKHVNKSFLAKTIALLIVFIIPPLMALCIFSVYIELTGHDLSPVVAFTTLSLFNTLRFPLVVLPKAIRASAEAASSLKRVQSFLLGAELQPVVREEEVFMSMNNATVSYSVSGTPILQDITFELPKGKLMGVCGSVASGKSTIISTLLGETYIQKGSVKFGGSLAYVPQTPWIQFGTVRDNITFGKEFDEKKYKEVVFACALETDFQIMPQGDMTIIGERGINLSGGQRQRISLARAAYSGADVYLLDSPLSAVDQLTGGHIFRHCFKTLLAGKTILLVTHQLHLLPEMDYIMVLKDGKSVYNGIYDEESMKKLFPQFQASHAVPTKHNSKKQAAKTSNANNLIPVATREKRGFYVYIDYFREMGFGWSAFSLLIYMGTQVIRIISDWWISVWTGDMLNASQEYYLGAYGGLVGAFAIALFIRGTVWYRLALRTATKMHNKMFKTITNAPMSYFTITPLGGIINSFSKDQTTVDESLPDSIHMTTIYTMILFTTMILVCNVFPYYVLVAAALIASFFAVQYYYLNSVRYLKLLTSETNAYIFAHFSETLSGLSVIRAFNAEDRFRSDSKYRINRNHRSQFSLDHVQLWSSFCLDAIASLLVLATCLFCVGLTINANLAGLAISNSLQKLVFFSMLVKGFADIEAQMNSVDMIANQYTKGVPQEIELKEQDPPTNWPEKGNIEFKNTLMRYFPHMDPALRGVSFEIKPGEKIGVVGRTGSGKSSLLMALFRLAESESGNIFVDGVDIAKLGLKDLRSRFAIIPQEPVLFKGTVRSNLDPFGKYTDQQLWDACELAHLKDMVAALPEKLEFPISEDGQNFSLGQKQLFCLARAILNNSRVLALDEATAAMDLETDALIQASIRKAFEKNTIITIAHRLDTIIDYDKILVMDAGVAVEFDTVHNLLNNPDSIFASLAAEAGIDPSTVKSKGNKEETPKLDKKEKKSKKSKKEKKEKKEKKSKRNKENTEQ